MRKELLYAGIIGILFGLVIGFGVWRVRSSMVPKDTPTPTSTPQIETGLKVAIDKPENFDVITESPTVVSGITKSGVWVIVSTEKGDYLTQSTTDGTFSVDTELTSGVNHIKVTAVDSVGNTSSQEILAVYSSSFQATASAGGTATNEADVNSVVAQKIAQAQKQPKAYIGTVTDIIDSTIQIKNPDAQIQQIATNKLPVAVVNIKGTGNKVVKLTDIAIGDFIVAMGYVDAQDVLDVQRILISDPPVKSEISISMHKVESVTKKSLILTPINEGAEVTVTPDKNTSIESYFGGKIKTIKLATIEVSDAIILVTDTTGSPPLARSIFDIGTE